MREFAANDRVIGSELRSALVDAPERATYVVTDTAPTSPTDLEVGCDAGAVVVDGDEVSVSAQTEAVSDITGEVTETAYRYHTLSVDATGALVVRSSPVGEFDADDPDAEPITQVTEPSHETGEVFIGTAFQVGGRIERVFDGRYVLDGVPNSVITQGEGSGLDADTVRGATAWTDENDGAGSGLDADTLREETPSTLKSPIFGDGDDGTNAPSSVSGEVSNFEDVSLGTVDVDDYWIVYGKTVDVSGTIRATRPGTGGAGGEETTGGDDGEDGADGLVAPSGAGGAGGSDNAGAGGDGGSRRSTTIPIEQRIRSGYSPDPILDLFEDADGVFSMGAGGGGGGGGRNSAGIGDADGEDGSPPGGGGEGATDLDDGDAVGGAGGDGGDGGGLVFIFAEEITGDGTIDASGVDGDPGLEPVDFGNAPGGSGGGGSGGLIVLVARSISDGITTDVSAGVGAPPTSDNRSGGAGADGESGAVYTVEL